VAAVHATDAICDGHSIPADVQDAVISAYGPAGIVELVVTCGLYAIMGYMVTSFDIGVEADVQAVADRTGAGG
jgi:hypothetical protein